jgi:hypothetical protein
MLQGRQEHFTAEGAENAEPLVFSAISAVKWFSTRPAV